MLNPHPARGSLAVGFMFPILDGIMVALRFWTRRRQNARYGPDDWLTLPAWLALTGCCVLILTGEYTGIFVDVPPTEPDDVTPEHRLQAQITGALFILWVGGNFFVKLAVLFFYRRVFVGRIFDMASKILIALSAVWAVYSTLSWLLYCGANVKANFEGGWLACPAWGLDIQTGVYLLDSLIDLGLLLLPVPLVWRLKMVKKRKIVLTGVFFLGALALGAGLVNTVLAWGLLFDPTFTEDGGDVSYFSDASLLYYNWLAIEVGVGLVACNIPTLSYHIIDKIPQLLGRGFQWSWTSLRNTAAILTLRSGTSSQRRVNDTSSHHSTAALGMPGARSETSRERLDERQHKTKSKSSKSSLIPSSSGGTHDTTMALEELTAPRDSQGATVTIRGHTEGYAV